MPCFNDYQLTYVGKVKKLNKHTSHAIVSFSLTKTSPVNSTESI